MNAIMMAQLRHAYLWTHNTDFRAYESC